MKVVVLISGGGTNLQSIIDACSAKTINAEVSAVLSNNPDAFGLQRASSAGIPTEVVDHRLYDSREAFDTTLREKIDHYHPQLLVLAGFMRILTPGFIEHYRGRMLNIHPSLLPEFRGLNTHQRALDGAVEKHGASVHFVTPELDGGPVVVQATVSVETDDNAETLAARVLCQEHVIYPRVIGWFADGRLDCKEDRVYLDGELITDPLALYQQ